MQNGNDQSRKYNSNRHPLELFTKNEPNFNNYSNMQQPNMLGSYRIRSAQNLAKQRSTGKF